MQKDEIDVMYATERRDDCNDSDDVLNGTKESVFDRERKRRREKEREKDDRKERLT